MGTAGLALVPPPWGGQEGGSTKKSPDSLLNQGSQ